MIGVFVKDGEAIESALRRFKRECINAGVQAEVKRNEFYEKPSETRKLKKEALARRKDKKRGGMSRSRRT